MTSSSISRPSRLLVTFIALSSIICPTHASPLSKIAQAFFYHIPSPTTRTFSGPTSTPHNHTLLARQGCPNACGFWGQLCCQVGETCYTNSKNEAACGSPAQAASALQAAASGPGEWKVYTSTWVETNAVTKTAVYSSWLPAAPTILAGAVACDWAADAERCGSTCCQGGYYCADKANSICKPIGNNGYTTTGIAGANVPALGTTISGVVVTSTIAPTTTMPYGTAVPTGTAVPVEGGGGLSPGAIAGIVIGVLLGIALLLGLCALCCLQSCLALLGLGKKKKKRGGRYVEETEVRRRHSHGRTAATLGAGAAAAAAGRRWYGASRTGTSSSSSSSGYPYYEDRKKKKGGVGIGGMLAGLAALFAFNKWRKRKEEKSSYTGSSGYGSYYSYSSYSECSPRSFGFRLRRVPPVF